MKRWGIVITVFYAIILALLLMPAGLILIVKQPSVSNFFYLYNNWMIWIWFGILLAGQALLLFLSVDTSWRRIKPRQRLAVTVGLASFFAALLTISALFSIGVGVYGDYPFQLLNGLLDVMGESWFFTTVLGIWIGLWVIWGGVFYQYYRDSSKALSEIVSWLLKGSVLELLIAVPAHVVVRHRDDCSAPAVTGWGIVTGIAIMLLCFGPGVLSLYKKKLDAYRSTT